MRTDANQTTPARRCALYLRVSTEKQHLDNQRADLVQLAKGRGLKIVAVFEETVSAAAKERPQFQKMWAAAHRGEFDSILVWDLSRFGRSMAGNLTGVLELDRIGVQVISVREPWLDMGSPTRSLLVGIFSWVAEQERLRLGERTRAGLERARASGKRIGRPRVAVDVDRALTMIATGSPLGEVAVQLGCGETTLRRALATARSLPPKGSETSTQQPPETRDAA